MSNIELVTKIKTILGKYLSNVTMRYQDADLLVNDLVGLLYVGYCDWQLEDEDTNNWESSCGHSFWLEEGNPLENEMKFCPFCGRELVQPDKLLDQFIENNAN